MAHLLGAAQLKQLAEPMPFQLHPHESDVQLGGRIADDVVGPFICNGDDEQRAAARDLEAGRAQPRKEPRAAPAGRPAMRAMCVTKSVALTSSGRASCSGM